MDAYIGTVMAWAPNFAPRGWMFCGGQTLSIAQYSALYSLLGVTYGGDGRNTFALPNLVGRVPLGAGQGAGLSPYYLGQQAGSENVTLNGNQMPSHNHMAEATNAPINVSSANADSATPAAGSSIAVPGVASGRDFTATLGFNSADPDTTLNKATSAAPGVTVGVAGGNQPHENLQPYLALNFIICIEGLFPPRD
jgi:microcystin-dependent protein